MKKEEISQCFFLQCSGDEENARNVLNVRDSLSSARDV